MPSSAILTVLVLMLSICLASSAEARKRAWSYHGNGFSVRFGEGDSRNTRAEGRRTRVEGRGARAGERGNRAAESSENARASTGPGSRSAETAESVSSRTGSGSFSSTIDRLIRACMQQATEFQNWPLEAIARIAAPDDRQRGALEVLRGAAAAAAERLSADCPRDVPAAAAERPEAVVKSIDAADSAFATIEPALQGLYAALDDEQKARLLSTASNAPARVRERGGEPREQPSQRTDTNGNQTGKVNRWAGICEDLSAGLRAWPISEIERGMRLSDQQRIALYELVTSSLRAAEKLAGSCPRQEALTPVRRMVLLRASLAAVREATTAIEPTLTRFYGALDEGQRVRFAEMR